MEHKWISTKQAAELLGVSQRTVQNWIDDGKLKSAKTPGGHRRLNPEDLKPLLQQQQYPRTHVANTAGDSRTATDLLRVLVIEDDYTILRLCELRFSQFSVPNKLITASNVIQGVFMAGKYQPDLIFTDLKMPVINGLQMIQELLKIPEFEKTKFVVITGLKTRDIMELGEFPEDIMILPKPIPFDTIETLLYQQAISLKLASTFEKPEEAG